MDRDRATDIATQTDQFGRLSDCDYDLIGNLPAAELPMVDDPADGLPDTPVSAMDELRE